MQVCRVLDMTYQTLKFYCNEGLIPNVKRDNNNRRIFDERDVKWIKDLICLKKMRHEYSGNERISGTLYAGRIYHTSSKRTACKKQEALRVTIKELEDSVAYIDRKQNFYGEVLSGKRPYVSNLIRTEK